MAKELVAILVTDNNGEAFHNYTGTGAGETTFTAESGDLESEPLVINDIQEKLTLTSDKNILSYADNESCTITATYEGPSVDGQTVVFKNGNTILATKTTDSNGIATYDYQSQGVGDVTFTVECMNLQETYEVHDYWKYIETGSKTFSSSSMTWEVLSDLNGIGDFELTYEISATGNQGFAIGMSSNNTDTSNVNNKVRGQVDGAGYYGTYTDINGSQTYTTYSSQYSANTYFTVTLQCIDGHITITHNGKTHTDNRTFNLRYLMIGNWKSAKTINYKNLIVKPLPFDGSMSVSASKDILSYADEDECVLTATLTGDNVANRPVVFKNGSTVLDTVNTDSNGVATYTYSSQGVGDVTITVECMNLQETYEIEDCYFYDTLTTDKQLFSIATGSGTLTYSNDGLTFRDSTSSETKVLFDKQLPTSDYEVSYDIVAYGNTNNKPQVCFEDFFLGINNNGYYGRRVSVSGNIWGETGSPTPPHTIKHKITGTSSKTVETYQNSTLLGTATSINQTRVMQIFAYENGRSITFANLKIKPLPFNGSLSVSASKDVLSYADNDSCILTATLTGDNVANRPVVFKNGNTVLDTVNTDSNSIATYEYESQGVGDVTFTFECSNVTETYDIKDAIKYYSGTLSTTTVISVPNLPTDFEMSWKTIRQSGKTAYMKFGLSEAHVIYGGILSTRDEVDNVGIYRYVQGEGNKQGGMISGYRLPTNVEKTITMRHENNTASISVDGYSTSFTNTTLTSRDYVRADINGGSIKEILIMPL